MRTAVALAALVVLGTCASPALGAPSVQRPGTEVGPPHSTTTFDPTKGCTGDGPVAAQGWCSYYDGASSAKAGQAVELAAVVCRLPAQQPYPLQVESGLQADFSLSTQDSSDALWTWSRGHRFSDYGTTFNVAGGSCLRWHVMWKVVDDAGRPLAPGLYHLMARPFAHQAGSIQAQAFINEVYFTVS